MKVELLKTFQFEAAHSNSTDREATSRLHGHSYRVDVHVEGACDPRFGWLIDYAEIAAHFDPLYRLLDHHHLNEVPGMKDTSIAGVHAWLHERLALDLEILKDIHVSIVGDCAYRPRIVDASPALNLGRRIQFGFEAAHYLPTLSETHKCRRMHGHSFLVEVAADDLDRLEPILRGAYGALDHRCLNEIQGLQNATSEQLARWLWVSLSSRVPDLGAVIVAETCTARCIYRGE